jgi:hypothetical protein
MAIQHIQGQSEMTTSLVRSSMKLMTDAGIDIVDIKWFDMTNCISDSQKANLDPLLTHRPPFEKCFVVWQGKTKSHASYEVLMLVAGDDPLDGITVSIWKGPTGTRLRPIPAMFYLIEQDKIRYGAVSDDEPVDKELAELMMAQIGAWYSAMDKRVEVYVPSIKETFTNRRKIEQGKSPTYDWTTIWIEPAKPRSGGKGGTHASPRLHDRRGHLRRLANGKNVWVKSCKVGDASKGAIFHDYAIKGQE